MKKSNKLEELIKEFFGRYRCLSVKCKARYPDIYKEVNELTKNLPEKTIFKIRLYLVANNMDSIQKCKICNINDAIFYSLMKGFSKYCSSECYRKDKELFKINRKKANATNLKKYGTINPSELPEIKEKIRQTSIKNWGVDNPMKSPEIQEKVKNIWMSIYGVDHNMKSSKVREKVKQTNLKRRNVECSFQCPIVKEKSKQTNLEKRNVEQSMQDPEVQKKGKETLFKNHGVRNPAHVKHFTEKSQETWMKNWGVNNPSKSPEIQEKKIQTCLENHNVEFPYQSEEIYKKCVQTCLENHNVDNPSKSPEIQEKKIKTCLEIYNARHYSQSKEYQIKIFKNIKKSLKLLNLELVDEEYQGIIFDHNWKCLKCNNIFKHTWQDMYKCPTCYPRETKTSIGEIEILEFVKSLNISNKIEHGTRKIINPLELDIYIPDLNIAIEFNGLHWHCEEIQELNINENHFYNAQTYHLYKTQKCEELGIQLIHIFEDEWYFNKEIVKSRLKQILGINNQQRIHARQCIVKEISPQGKNEFLDKFHIQGPDSSSIKLGAFHNENLVSIMTFSKGNISKGSKSKEGVWELNRFCSDFNFYVPGIAGKLLTHFKKNYDWSEIFSYADRRWSKGNLYRKLGFELLSRTGPNYWYINLNEMKRIHRFNLRKKPNEPKDITERILRLNEGYKTIWDCGSLKFSLKKEI